MTALIAILTVIALFLLFYKLNQLKQHADEFDQSLSEIKNTLKTLSEKQDVSQEAVIQKKLGSEKTKTTMPQEVPQSSLQEILQMVQEKETLKKEQEPVIQEASEIEKTQTEPITQEISPEKDQKEASVIQKPEIIYQETYKKPTPQAPHKDTSDFFKNFFNESLLGKFGIVTLVAGIGFFVKYAIDQNWINEIGRVSIGILTGAIIIGLAHYLHKKYKVFSAILAGGGISVLYITITLAFREYQLFSQTLAFVLLSAVTVFSVVLSLLYDRKELALFSLLGGYASPLLVSTGSGNYIVLFSFMLILNTGMLLISMRKNWTIIKIVSFISTILFYFSWLLLKFEEEYTGASIFALLFFAQFYIVVIFDHLLSGKVTPLQLIIVLSNNMALLMAGYRIFIDVETNYLGLVTILIAAINAVVMIILLRNKRIDKNMIYALIAVVLSLVSLAIPIQLKGHVITLFWAAEAVILTWLWKKTKIRIFNIAFQVIHLLTIISWMVDAINNYDTNGLPIIINRIFITGLTVIASYVICLLILRKESSEKIFTKILTVALWLMAYFVPFLEIRYHFQNINVYNITETALFAWTISYLAVLARLCRATIFKSQTSWKKIIPIIGLATLLLLVMVKWFRDEIFSYEDVSHHWFSIHYLIFPGLIYLFYLAAANVYKTTKHTLACWVLSFLGVILILAEADNILIHIWGNQSNYVDLLHGMHTFGYPILCGLIAMALMIWGLQKKIIILRKISLTFFGIIILKFYLIDVWRMSQSGRILSFIALGIILLLVYFLLQKIKGLVTSEKEPVTRDNKDNEELNQ